MSEFDNPYPHAAKHRLTPNPGVADVHPYTVPHHGAPIDLRLDANEGPELSPAFLAKIIRTTPDLLRRYPDSSALQQQFANRHQVETDRVLVTAGGDDALDRLCRALLGPGRELITTDPGFEMLPRYARVMGAEVTEIMWPQGPFPTDEVISRISRKTTVVAFVSPNNPTGSVGTVEDLRAISAAAPHAVILADFAYIEFADQDLTEIALSLPNCVMVRTLSKAWGLAGLRVGYAVGSREVIQWMRSSGGPYAVARPSIAMAMARLEADRGEMQSFVKQVREDRAQIEAMLASCGATVGHSQANFVFALLEDPVWLRDALAGLGIAVRAFPTHPKLFNALRVSCPGNAAECSRLLTAIRAALRPDAVLLSLDDVIFDTRETTNQMLLKAARLLTSIVDLADIQAARSLEQGMNSAQLLYHMVNARGISTTTAMAEEAWNTVIKDHRSPGFSTDKPLVSAQELKELKGHCKLVLLTHRSEEDTQRLLVGAGLDGIFSSVIQQSMMPQGEQLKRGLASRGFTHAWLVTRDGPLISTARKVGIVPIGLITRRERTEVEISALIQQGAARVVEDLRDVMNIFETKG